MINSHGARLLSVQVGTAKEYHWLGRELTSSIKKDPVSEPVKVLANSLEGDEQADPKQYGGKDKAVYAYAAEDYALWSATLGRDVGPASFGENLITEGLDPQTMVIGTRWHIGSAVLEVSEPRTPCWKLGMAMGDPIKVGESPEHGITAVDVINMYDGEKAKAPEILAVPQLAEHWLEWAAHRKIWHLEEERDRATGQRARVRQATNR